MSREEMKEKKGEGEKKRETRKRGRERREQAWSASKSEAGVQPLTSLRGRNDDNRQSTRQWGQSIDQSSTMAVARRVFNASAYHQ